MRLETLTVRGMLRFSDAVAVDLRTLPAGLIAVVGENGSGKTTLVESGIAALYRTFPSRADRELFDYADGRDSYLEALYAVEGRGSYRARVNLDGIKRTADAVLEQLLPDGSKAILNDGKVSTFDQAVAGVFPARAVLLASAVAAQNKAGSFITLDRKGRKDLFSQLLGLEHYEDMATTARTAVGLCEGARQKLATQRELLSTAAAPALGAALDADEVQLLAARVQATTRRDTLTAHLAEQEQARIVVQDAAARHLSLTTRLAALADKSAGLLMQMRTIRTQESAAGAAAESEQHVLEQNRQRRLTDLDERIANNETVRGDADAIRAAVATLQAAQQERTAAVEAEQRARLALDRGRDDVRACERRIVEANQADQDLARANTATATLSTVPCRGEGAYARCGFLAQAVRARSTIDALTAKASVLPTLRTELLALETQNAALVAPLQGAEAARRTFDARIAAVEERAKRLPALENAEKRLAELRTDRAYVVAEVEAQLAALAARVAATSADLGRQYAEAQAAVDQVAQEIADVQREADATADASARLTAIEQDLATARADREGAIANVSRLEAMLEDLARRRARWLEACAQVGDVETRLTTIEQEGLDWQLLAKALGRDGLPVLEIDAAGPTVSSFTNDLLGVCFGPRFTVELVTQTPKADGKGSKEVFELKVLDNLRGGDARDIGDLSGGEQILVDEALKNALALFVNSRNVAPIETCWRDETTGPLDPDNATRYLEMLRRVQQIGGFHQILFVTHNAAAASSADAQIRVADGAVTMALPPYGAAQEAA